MPRFEVGDYIKVEFKDEGTGESEWMWVIVEGSDELNRLVFGRLDSQPVLDYGDKLKLGSQLAVSYDKIREHRKPTEFTRQ